MLNRISLDRYPSHVPDIIDVYKETKYSELKNKTLDVYSIVYYNIRWAIIALAFTLILIKKDQLFFKYIYGLLALIVLSKVFMHYKLDLFLWECYIKEKNMDSVNIGLEAYSKYFSLILFYILIPILIIMKIEPETPTNLSPSSNQDTSL